MEWKNYAKKKGEERTYVTSRTIESRLISDYNILACRTVVNTVKNCLYERQRIP